MPLKASNKILRVPKNLGFSFGHPEGEASQKLSCWSRHLPEERLVRAKEHQAQPQGLPSAPFVPAVTSWPQQ